MRGLPKIVNPIGLMSFKITNLKSPNQKCGHQSFLKILKPWHWIKPERQTAGQSKFDSKCFLNQKSFCREYHNFLIALRKDWLGSTDNLNHRVASILKSIAMPKCDDLIFYLECIYCTFLPNNEVTKFLSQEIKGNLQN